MMATTLIPPTPASKVPQEGVRFVAVRANLMPDEIISGRQVLVARKQVLAGLVVVVIVLIGWYGLSWWQTRSANSTLDRAQAKGVSLQSQQQQFAPLVNAEQQITSIQAQLSTLMVGDLPWKTMLTTLRAKAPDGVTLSDVSGVMNSTTTGTLPTAGGALNTTGNPTVGTLTITGFAPDKRSVAAYADGLSTVTGIAAPLISDVEATERPISFTISAVITSDALGGRYATAPTTTTTTTTPGGN
jgi:Tfp pilus assembly protein PilN